MNPLSPFTYYRRHKGWAFLLTALVSLAVAGLYLVLGLLRQTFITPAFAVNGYLTKFSLLLANPGGEISVLEREEIGRHPDVERVIGAASVEIALPRFGMAFFPFRLIGLREADAAAVLETCHAELREGRLPRPGTPEVALSREVASALGVGVGETLDRSKDEWIYASIARPLEVVGILSADVRLGILSYEFLSADSSYRGIAQEGLLIFAKPGRGPALDEFLRGRMEGSDTTLITESTLKEKNARDSRVMYVVGVPLALLVTAAITLVIGAVNQLAFLRRLPEFGVLHAVGRGRSWLASRLIVETGVLAVFGSGLGILLACGIMTALNAAVYIPAGYGLIPLQAMELLFIAPIPLAVVGFTLRSAFRAIGRMDPVAIVERGELTQETGRTGGRGSGRGNPLSPATFYRRHGRQAAALIGAMALMIMGAGLFIFMAGIFDDARQPMLNHLARMSVLSPESEPIRAADQERIRAHESVERVIPAYRFSALGIAIPPITPNYPGEAFAVAEEDLAYLVDLFGLTLAQGRLPRAGSNEIVVPGTFARNRNLAVGDTIGDPDHPAFREAPALPDPLVVSGIFAPAGARTEDVWLSFVSLEFVESRKEAWQGPLSLIVIPKGGRNEEMEAFLDRHWGGGDFLLVTRGNQAAEFQEQARTLTGILGLLEGILAFVAAATLAGLNLVYVAQRKIEFGTLHALGISRRRLIGRALGEAVFTSAAAWLGSVLFFAAAVLAFQGLVYEPAGLRLNFFNPTPWLFTLPVPAAVILAGGATATWILSRLDPVAIIERR